MRLFSLEEAKKLCFHLVGEVTLTSTIPEIRLHKLAAKNEKAQGWVYLWIGRQQTVGPKLLYIGQTGKTLRDRKNTHQQGFKESKKGKAHNHRLTEMLNNGYRVEIWARRSDLYNVLGQKVRGSCVEELALIAKWQPAWNGREKEVKKFS
jgi:hypothetical protein